MLMHGNLHWKSSISKHWEICLFMKSQIYYEIGMNFCKLISKWDRWHYADCLGSTRIQQRFLDSEARSFGKRNRRRHMVNCEVVFQEVQRFETFITIAIPPQSYWAPLSSKPGTAASATDQLPGRSELTIHVLDMPQSGSHDWPQRGTVEPRYNELRYNELPSKPRYYERIQKSRSIYAHQNPDITNKKTPERLVLSGCYCVTDKLYDSLIAVGVITTQQRVILVRILKIHGWR